MHFTPEQECHSICPVQATPPAKPVDFTLRIRDDTGTTSERFEGKLEFEQEDEDDDDDDEED